MFPGNSFKSLGLKNPKSRRYLDYLLLLDAAASLTAFFVVVAPLLIVFLGVDAKERLCGSV